VLKNTRRIVLLLFSVLSLCLQAESLPRGVYSLMWANHALKKGVPLSVELNYIDGITLYMQWKELEPQSGKYKWELIDNVVNKAEAAGKKVNIGVFSGHWAPDFVIKASRSYVNKKQQMHGGMKANKAKQQVRYPVTWEDPYLSNWKRLIKAIAERYKNSPAVQGLFCSGLGGQAIEMAFRIKPENYDDFRTQTGFSIAKMEQAWFGLIDFYEKVWPKAVIINLAMTMSDGGMKKSMELPLAVEKYALKKLPCRVAFITTYLNGKWFHTQDLNDPKCHAAPMVFHFKDIGQKCWTGGEMFWASSKPSFEKSVNGPMKKAVENAREWNMKWIQVYQDDICPFGTTNLMQGCIEDLKMAHKLLVQ